MATEALLTMNMFPPWDCNIKNNHQNKLSFVNDLISLRAKPNTVICATAGFSNTEN